MRSACRTSPHVTSFHGWLRSATLTACLLLAGVLLPERPASAQSLALIPMPAHVTQEKGRYTLDATTRLQYSGQASASAADEFARLLARSHAISLQPTPSSIPTSGAGIEFVLDPTAKLGPEDYRLTVGPLRIEVVAAQAPGLFYGAITLWQLLPPGRDDHIAIPAVHIEDTPRFPWRGLMLDSARHFQSPEQVKQLLDAMAVHKLNVFHWHLTDDQGWRIQILRYPNLTQVGGCREKVDMPGAGSQECGFYTQAQIREIVAYAAARQITVVPEIDVPGHATAAIAAYPQLGTTGQRLPVSNERGIHANLFNVDEGTFEFLDQVLAEVAELFPGDYIHIGGDEAIKDQWRASTRVQQRRHELGLADEAQLQAWFITRLEAMLVKRGKRLIGWDEILEGALPASATVMSWRGTDGGIAAARAGHDVVMSPSPDLYLDYLQTDTPGEPAGRPKTVPLRTVYAFDPVPAELTSEQRQHVLGLQANLWTGDIADLAGLEHAAFPRLAAVAETGWTPQADKDYDTFLARLPTQLRRYRELGIGYASTPFSVVLTAAATGEGRARITLSNPLGYPIHYNINGGPPDTSSPAYRAPLDLALPVTITAAAFADGKVLAAPMSRLIDATTLLRHEDEQLEQCAEDGPVLRMANPRSPEAGGLFNVAILAPCWRWSDAPLDGIGTIRVRAARLPYRFRLGSEEERRRRFLPATTAQGELDIRIDGCDGPRLATAAMPAHVDAEGLATVLAPVRLPARGAHTLCIRFSGDTRPQMWVLDQISLQPTDPE